MTQIVTLTPYRLSDGRVGTQLLERCMAQVAAQDYPHRHVVMPNAYPWTGQRYGNHARARNALQATIPPEYGIWWIDADIVTIPPNTLAELVRASEALGGAVVAPMVHIEAAGNQYDGWFYDIGTFCTADGRWAKSIEGLPGEAVFEAMRYVGVGAYVPPGVRAEFAPVGNEIETLSYIDAIARQGVPVYAARMLRIDHANLPAYGLEWH